MSSAKPDEADPTTSKVRPHPHPDGSHSEKCPTGVCGRDRWQPSTYGVVPPPPTVVVTGKRPGGAVVPTCAMPDIEPFTLDVPESELTDLRRRLADTRWPEKETVDDWSQGIPLAYVQDLCDYWADGYDWRRCEARLNELGQFRTEIDGLGIHFLHVRSPHDDAVPLVMTHGWPGSVVEFLNVIEPLTEPDRARRERGRRLPRGRARRCPATGSATSRPRPAGEPRGSRRCGTS